MDTFKLIYSVLGGLGIFFYGMNTMSDSLQMAAGDMIKKIINSITRNRVLAVLIGCGVTMIVQSSSVTTVMVVGFVNAGLMTLKQSIGVIFGANIGTTVTGWIISIKIGKYGLLLIGLGIFPTLFAKTEKWKQVGRFLFGIGMIFFGLQIMSNAFKPLRSMPEFLDAISYFNAEHYGSYIASILVGCILTMIVQSSSAMLGITIAMASSGVIDFHTAAALVLGENIGTTITALLASVGGNVNAKRAARAHAIFNMLGVLTIFAVFPYYVEFIEWLIPGDANFINAAGDKPNIAVHIASGHTIFNVSSTLIFLPFLQNLSNLVVKITPDKPFKEAPHLIMLGNAKDMVPATALVQAEEELKKMKDIVDRMFSKTLEYIKEDKGHPKVLAKIKDYERITDNIQKEIVLFVCSIMEKPLSHDQSVEAQAIVRLADELESVADYLDKLVTFKTRLSRGEQLSPEAKEEFFTFFDEVQKFYHQTSHAMFEPGDLDKKSIDSQSEYLRIKAEDIRRQNLKRVADGEYSALTALTFSDMVVALRKIRSHSHNIYQSVARMS